MDVRPHVRQPELDGVLDFALATRRIVIGVKTTGKNHNPFRPMKTLLR